MSSAGIIIEGGIRIGGSINIGGGGGGFSALTLDIASASNYNTNKTIYNI